MNAKLNAKLQKEITGKYFSNIKISYFLKH